MILETLPRLHVPARPMRRYSTIGALPRWALGHWHCLKFPALLDGTVPSGSTEKL